MTFSSSGIFVTPWTRLNTQAPGALSVALHQPPPKGTPPIDLPIQFVWPSYNLVNFGDTIGVSIQLSQLGGQQQTLDAVRSIYIDNTGVSMPIYVQFGDTSDVIYCPPYSTIIAPIYTNILNAIIYATDYTSIGTTTVHFCNFAQDAYVSPPTEPPGASIIAVDDATINGAATSFTFNNLFKGSANIRRHCTVFCYSQGQQVTTANQPIITVGGVNASLPSYFSPYSASFLATPPGGGVYTNITINNFYIPQTGLLPVVCNFLAKSQNMCYVNIVTYLNGANILGPRRSFGATALRRGVTSSNGLVQPGALTFGWFAYNNNGALPVLTSSLQYSLLSSVSDETNKFSAGLVSFGINAAAESFNLIADPAHFVAIASQA